MSKTQIAQTLATFEFKPLEFVLFSFPWGESDLSDHNGPEQWQANLLRSIGDGLLTVDQAIQTATASGHGVGKSALVAWIILWAISTKADTRGIVTANTETQLRTKTWPELTRWYNRFVGREFFKITATSIYSADKNYERTWRIDAIPWSETKTESFAGLHNKGNRIVCIFDEASAIPGVIWEVTEGALTDEGTQILWAVFGNPTRNSGRFRECFSKNRHRWRTFRVDSREVKITNKEQISRWIEDYGEDSDFVKVRVRGDFPSLGDMQFIPSDIVQQARGRHLREEQYNWAPVVIGVDPGWSKDEGVIYLRQGLMSKKLMVYQGVKDDFEIAGWVARFEDEYKADGVFIDLGYGTGIYSGGKQMGRSWVLVAFGGASSDEGYLNKRADMWRQMRDWLKSGGAIEDDSVLCDELCSVEAGVVSVGKSAGKVKLESKEDMARRGVESPNRADGLALTFAFPVLSKSQKQFNVLTSVSSGDNYDVLAIKQGNEGYCDYSPSSPLANVKTWDQLMKKGG
jgi:hypothetical protein